MPSGARRERLSITRLGWEGVSLETARGIASTFSGEYFSLHGASDDAFRFLLEEYVGGNIGVTAECQVTFWDDCPDKSLVRSRSDQIKKAVGGLEKKPWATGSWFRSKCKL